MEDFYEVAAARMAELSPEGGDEDEDGTAIYAEDTPTPRLVIIAENIDSVSEGKSLEEAPEPDLSTETFEDDEDDYDDVDDDHTQSRTEVSDSGVNDLSSTAATTPEESSIFSPQPTHPAGIVKNHCYCSLIE